MAGEPPPVRLEVPDRPSGRRRLMAIQPIPADRAEWLKLRADYLGASEVCALTGIQADFHKSEYMLWAVKSGKIERPDYSNKRTRSGNAFEDGVAQYTAEERGWRLQPGVFAIDDDAPRFAATLDRVVLPSAEDEANGFVGPGALEAKYVEWDQRDKWADGDPPPYYLIQLQAQLACTGWLWGAVCARVGSQHIVRPYLRHEGIIARIREEVGRFWARVDAGEEPSASDYYASTEQALKAVYPRPEPKSVIDLRGNNELPVLCAEYVEVVERRKKDEKREQEIENTFRQLLGPNETAMLAGGFIVSRKIGKASEGRPAKPGEIIGARRASDSIKISVEKEKAA
jgi:putative phage-type endonuclease